MKTDQDYTNPNSDQLFNSYLGTKSELEAEPILIELITDHAEPLIRKIVTRKISNRSEFGKSQVLADSEDLCSIIKLKLLSRLRDLRSTSNEKAIKSFLDYVAVASFNACNEYFRQANPMWLRFRNHLRYLLSHHKDFSMWKIRKTLLCGLAKWKGRTEICSQEMLSKIVVENASKDTFQSQLRMIFTKTSLPVRFVDIVNLFSRFSEGVTTVPAEENLDLETISFESKVEKDLELKTFFQKLWNEIGVLPLKQRIALLLSLRDENGSAILHLFPMLGIAKVKELAIMMEMKPESFAMLWRDLPLEDNRIAEQLQITRQQVINLRKCARERLARKLG